MSFRKIKDGITPDLKRKARALNPAGRKKALQAMAEAAISLATQAFNQPDKRPSAWAPRQDDEPHSLLQKTTTMRQSLRVISANSTKSVIGSDREYAAVHQLGSKKQNIPARPYLPFYRSGRATELGSRRIGNALRAVLRTSGL